MFVFNLEGALDRMILRDYFSLSVSKQDLFVGSDDFHERNGFLQFFAFLSYGIPDPDSVVFALNIYVAKGFVQDLRQILLKNQSNTDLHTRVFL